MNIEKNKDHLPFFSVLVPVYNKETEVAKCLDSILGQSFEDIEVIAVDDGSEDNSYEVLLEYAEWDKRLKVIRKEKNSSLLSARITGMMAATGKYVLFVDSDDYIDPDTCMGLYGYLSDNPVDVVEFEIVNEPGKDLLSGFYQNYKIEYGNYKKKTIDELINKMLLLEYPHNICNKCCSIDVIKRFLERTNVFYCNIYEDMYFSVSILSLAKSYGRINGLYYHYVRLNNGMTADTGRIVSNVENIMLSIKNINNGLSSFFNYEDSDFHSLIQQSTLLQVQEYANICMSCEKSLYEKMGALRIIDSYWDTDYAVKFEEPFEWYEKFHFSGNITKIKMLASKMVGKIKMKKSVK